MLIGVCPAPQVRPCTTRWPALQSTLLRVSLIMDAAVPDVLPHLLVVVVILPLLSTVEVRDAARPISTSVVCDRWEHSSLAAATRRWCPTA